MSAILNRVRHSTGLPGTASPLRVALKARTLTSDALSKPPAGSKLTKQEEQRSRVEAMAEMMREKTLREVEAAGASRRPEGVNHLADNGSKTDGGVDAAIVDAFGSQYAANYDEDRDEWGGPKGAEPTRFGDWERKGRATDF